MESINLLFNPVNAYEQYLKTAKNRPPVKIYEGAFSGPGPIVGGYFRKLSMIDYREIVDVLELLDNPPKTLKGKKYID